MNSEWRAAGTVRARWSAGRKRARTIHYSQFTIRPLEFVSHNSVALLTFPPGEGYPRLRRAVLQEMRTGLELIRHEELFHGIVIASAGETFATGADLEEIVKLEGLAGRQFAAEEIIIITVYEPDPALWGADFKRRKS